jgi:PPOX class probable F420-dependent enzyme
MTPRGWPAEFLRKSRLAHLATSTNDGLPHVVPVCYAYDGKVFYSSIDEKPKRSAPDNLRRVFNISHNPRISLVVDSYSEDWRKLRYVIVNGSAKIMRRGSEHSRAVSLLKRKYQQYLSMRIEQRPIVKIKPSRIIAWRSC